MGMFREKRDFEIPSTGLDLVESIRIGNVEHTVLIQAVDPTKPVLLFVHGGPCLPVPGVVSRGQDYAISIATKELVKHFIVVFYDQRGAGKTYDNHISRDSFRVEQYIQDCNELIDILHERFKQDKIFLAAHSWGTVIGLSIAKRFPEKLYGYFGISQIVNWTENDKFCFDWLQKKALQAKDRKTLKKLEEIGKPPYLKVKQWTDFRRPLIKYKSMIYESDTVKHPGMISAFKQFFNSREYSLLDIFHAFYSSFNFTYTQELIEDFAKVQLNELKRLDTPVAFLHGKNDIHVDGKPVEDFYNEVEAPFGKDFVWYEYSSHMFHPKDAKMIETYIIEYAQNLFAKEKTI